MTFNFNFIYVIQSLPDIETQTGTYLFNDIIKVRCSQLQYLDAVLIDVTSATEFFSALTELSHDFNNRQIFPYLHFEIHGCETGLQMKNGDFVGWTEIRPLLSKINYNIGNRLFISLATCYGAFMYRAIDVFEHIPFFAYVGPVTEIKQKEVEADWTSYFDLLLTTKNFHEAIVGLNTLNTKAPYAFFTAEEIFELTKKMYLKMLGTRKAKREKLKSLTKNAKNFPAIKENYTRSEQNQHYKNFLNQQPQLWERIKNHFMMRP